MPFRFVRAAPVAKLGQISASSRKHVALILSVPALSLIVPGLAVEVASAGGQGELPRIAAALAKFLLFYSGVFALVGLSAAVAAGLLATDRLVMTPERRILAQALHRTMSLIGISALANHILLEILASRAKIADGFIPFLAARSTLFMGLGTISSDLFILIIVTGVLRRRFSERRRPVLWRVLHLTAYAAWPMAILHGLLAGRSAKAYVDWSYGACLAAAGLALIVRHVMLHRGSSSAPDRRAPRTPTPWSPPRENPAAALARASGAVPPALGSWPWPPPPATGRLPSEPAGPTSGLRPLPAADRQWPRRQQRPRPAADARWTDAGSEADADPWSADWER